MNEKGRFEHEDSEVSEGRLHADEEVNLAIAAIRAHKVDHQCEIERPVDESIPAAS